MARCVGVFRLREQVVLVFSKFYTFLLIIDGGIDFGLNSDAFMRFL